MKKGYSLFIYICLVVIALFLLSASRVVLANDITLLEEEMPPIGEPDYTSMDCSTVTEISVAECNALVAIFDSTHGSTSWTNSTNWKITETPCDWYGVTCDTSVPKKVTRVLLQNNGLTGTLPTQLGSLVNVYYLDLGNNAIGGELRAEIGSMSGLVYLHLENNELTGGIPNTFSALSNLLTMNLSGNQLIGTIPSSFGGMTNLSQLVLYYNQFSGSIPSALGDMTNMSQLVLYGNELTGEIPEELGKLSNLWSLMLNDNQLSGSIPPDIGSLSNLFFLYLENNQLTGSIPTQLGNLTNLQHMYLSSNLLEGAIPSQLGSLANLKTLRLDDNDLTGSIPAQLGSATNLLTLKLNHNNLSGKLPVELGALSNLTELYLNNNAFTGGVPESFANLTSLQELIIKDNLLKGSLPFSLIALEDLQNFQYNNTSLCASTDSAFQAWLGSISYKVVTWNCLVAPMPISPVDYSRTKDTTPLLKWSSVSNAEKYQLMVDNNSAFTSPEYNNAWLVITSKAVGNVLAEGTYFWRVRALDPGGNWSPWSVKWKFTVDTTPPAKPVLLSPVNLSSTTDRTPTFKWNMVTSAVKYQLMVDDNATFTSPVYNSSMITTLYKTMVTALAPKVYYWRVRAQDAAGNWSAWSTVWKVTVK